MSETREQWEQWEYMLMGVLTKYRKTLAPNTKEQEESCSESNAMQRIEIILPEEKPCPCLECFSPTFWRAIYGGPLRCAVCDPWPSRSLVGERWTIYLHSGTVPIWIPCLRPGEHTRDVPAPNNLADQAESVPGWKHKAIDDDLGAWWRFERCDR